MPVPHSTLVLGGAAIDFEAPGSPAFLVQSLHLDLDEHDAIEFTENTLAVLPSHHEGESISFTPVGLAHPYFLGRIVGRSLAYTGEDGNTFAYKGLGGKYLANLIKVTDPHELTGGITYNRSTEDPLWLATDAGLTIGAMIGRVLDAHATQLASYGIAGYVAADLVPLAITPPQPVEFAGRLMDAIDGNLERWQGLYVARIAWNVPTGDWRVRIVRPRDFPITTLAFGTDPIDPASFHCSRDTTNCFTRVVVRGRAQIGAALLSLADGTLAPAWTSTQQADWNWSDFIAPTGAVSSGSIVSLGAQQATLQPDDVTETWTLNQWVTAGAKIYLITPLATDATFSEMRIISANAVLASGGTALVQWTGDAPLPTASATKYHIVGQPPDSISDVYRRLHVVPPWVKAHMSFKFPIGVEWQNGTTVTLVNYPAASIDWTNTTVGAYYVPTDALAFTPMLFESDRQNGDIRFTEPYVKANNSISDLQAGGANVKPVVNVRVILPYSKGPMEAVCPPDAPGYGSSGGYGGGGTPQYQGTAFTECGITETWYEDVDSWLNLNDLPSMEALACMILDTFKDIQYDGSVAYTGLYAAALDLSLGLAFTGQLGAVNVPFGLETINCPVRGVTLHFPSDSGAQWLTEMRFNNRRQLATGENVFIHRAFALDPRNSGGGGNPLFGGSIGFGSFGGGFGGSQVAGVASSPFADNGSSGSEGVALPGGGKMDGSGMDQMARGMGAQPGLSGEQMDDLAGLIAPPETAGPGREAQPGPAETMHSQEMRNRAFPGQHSATAGLGPLEGFAPGRPMSRQGQFQEGDERRPATSVAEPEMPTELAESEREGPTDAG